MLKDLSYVTNLSKNIDFVNNIHEVGNRLPNY